MLFMAIVNFTYEFGKKGIKTQEGKVKNLDFLAGA